MALHEDRRRISVRLSVLQYALVVVFTALAVSFWVLQVVQHVKFKEMAENNIQRTLPLRAPRGVVLFQLVELLPGAMESRRAQRGRIRR